MCFIDSDCIVLKLTCLAWKNTDFTNIPASGAKQKAVNHHKKSVGNSSYWESVKVFLSISSFEGELCWMKAKVYLRESEH